MFAKKSTKELVHGEAKEKKEKPEKIWKIGNSGQERERKKERPHNDRTPIFRTKVFWGVVSILLGLTIAFVGVPMLQASVTETKQTVCFAQDVKAGTKVTEELLTTTDMSLYHLPIGAVHGCLQHHQHRR